MIRLVLGGDKSGKSAFALTQLEADCGPRILLATGQAADFSFRQQILDHRTARDPHIPVRETGADLVAALRQSVTEYKAVLIDSLDFWLFACREAGRMQYQEELAECLKQITRDAPDAIITFVSCEAGLGAIPASSATRLFIRELGSINQMVAACADEVCLMVAGLPVYLKRH
ncbi:bifunctional adenosylcobinamide kinase/adenosylcobinamide-phosphate guanylyltransferase [Oleidesulfovibrio sp.]|uniref:bifunctional adenosylcobinamide kinase/adenosylcobinamide-phosphate guanylyltransferase n=1 Tax=Oleidesulfovibrio sp. TaxID=2909707 RepID=UPI003A8A4405